MRLFLLGFLLVASLSNTALAQEQEDRSEFAVSYMGDFPSAANDNHVNQGASGSGGVLADYRFLFTPHQGVEVDYGFTRNTQQYLASTGAAGVHDDMHEATASYVFRVPLGHAAPFLSAGVGGVVFKPLANGTLAPLAPETQARVAFAYGVGIDLSLSKHLTLRPEYRALIFEAPDFGTSIGAGAPVHFAELACGFGWKF